MSVPSLPSLSSCPPPLLSFLQSLDALDPLIALGLSRCRQKPNHSDIRSNSTTADNNPYVNEILRTADFLYGSALDGALSLLETDPRRDILRLVSLQSRRCMYIVKGSSTNGRGGYQSNPIGTDSSYMCMLPELSTDISDQAEDASCIVRESNPSTYYCSCRSFLERCRTGNGYCKHLLAIKLMPVLCIECSVIELASDDEYCKNALQRISMD